MAVSIWRAPTLASIILIILTGGRGQKIFKLTRVECLNVDKDFSTFEYCRLKAIRRNVAVFSFKLQLHQTIRDCSGNLAVLRKYNGYKPFIINSSFDTCKYFKSGINRSSFFSVVYALFSKYSNLNHTCPYEGAVVVDKFYPEHDNLQLPLPTGDYLFLTTWTMQKQIRLKVNLWFSFEENEKIPNEKPR